MSHSDRFPHDVKSVNGQRETFKTVVVTVDKVFTNFGTGYSFVEDTTVDDQGRKPIWNMQGNYTNGKREDYAGVVFEAGDRIEVDLSLNPGRGSKIFYDIKRAAKVREGTEVTQYDAPAPAVKATPIDVRISKGMAFNNLTTMLASPESEQAFSGNLLAAAWDMWHKALEDTMAGKSPFSREADVIADAVIDDGVVDLADVTPVPPPADPLDELVENVPWNDGAPSVEDLKQKGVALMQSKWDTPIDAADELRGALGLPQDWSQMTAEQWQSVIDFAEAKASE
jgi:hypothetical protein|tara:strand:+ start:4176 stop:5024 length:849 start_codon:yes stop_codon:yes gene_type:complete